MCGDFILETDHEINLKKEQLRKNHGMIFCLIPSNRPGVYPPMEGGQEPESRNYVKLRLLPLASGLSLRRPRGRGIDDSLGFRLQGTLGEINGLFAACTNMLPVELV
jgi:hypothetical protein